jgi:hypothetical protein
MPSRVKRRDPLRSALLDIVTFGIYGFYWFYVTNRDLAELGRARGTTELGENPMNSFLAAMPGFFVLIPFFASVYNTADRVRAAQRLTGTEEDMSNTAAVLLSIPFPAAIYYFQKRLNRIWDAA